MMDAIFDCRSAGRTSDDNSEAFDRCIRAAGFRSAKALSDACGFGSGGYNAILNWRRGNPYVLTPVCRTHELHPYLKKIMEVTGFMEWELLPGYFRNCCVDRCCDIVCPGGTREDHEKEFLKCALPGIAMAMKSLSERWAIVLKMRFGIGSYNPLTLSEVGRRLGVSPARAQQIEDKALRKLRRPWIMRKVQEAFDAMQDIDNYRWVAYEKTRITENMEEQS